MILKYPNPILKKECTSIPDKETLDIFKDHFKTLVAKYESKALGLAAPQTGLTYALAWVKGLGVIVNPEIVDKSVETIHSYESCLSIDGLVFTVERPKRITVRYRDENFVEKIEAFHDNMAIILHHEIDHLNGLTLKETGTEVILAANAPAEA